MRRTIIFKYLVQHPEIKLKTSFTTLDYYGEKVERLIIFLNDKKSRFLVHGFIFGPDFKYTI